MISMFEDVKRMDEAELNDHVQTLTLSRKFDTAAQLIAEWVYWDEVKKEVKEIVEWERALDNPFPDGLAVPLNKTSEVKPQASVKDRMVQEFGENWHD